MEGKQAWVQAPQPRQEKTALASSGESGSRSSMTALVMALRPRAV